MNCEWWQISHLTILFACFFDKIKRGVWLFGVKNRAKWHLKTRSTSPAAAQFNNISRTSCSNKASIKASERNASCCALNQSKQFFICPPALWLFFTRPAAFSLNANEIKSSLIKIPVDIFTPRDYAAAFLLRAHIHTHKRGEQETGCVFFAHTEQTHTPRRKNLAARSSESELFSRLKTQHAALHLHCQNCTPLFLSFPHMVLFKNTALYMQSVCEIFQHAGIREMCLLIEADWFLPRRTPAAERRNTFSRNHLLFVPSCCCQLTRRELFAPAVIVVVVLPSLYQNAFCQSRCERKKKKIFAAPYSLRFVCLYHSHLLYNGSLRERYTFSICRMLWSFGGYETCILWKIMTLLTKSKHFQRESFSHANCNRLLRYYLCNDIWNHRFLSYMMGFFYSFKYFHFYRHRQ